MSEKKRFPWLFSLLIIIMFWMTACREQMVIPTPTIPATSADAVRTAAAQTADARLNAIPSPTPNPPTPDMAQTQTAEAVASPTASPDAAQPTAATLTPTPAASPTPTAPPAGSDNASFVKDITIPDNTVIAAGAKFTKTWQFLNSGTSAWTTDYELVWVEGDSMGATLAAKVPLAVPAGQVADISVELTAPTTSGTYKGFWRMRNSAGQFFGDAVYVQIKVGDVAATPDPNAASVTNLAVVVDNANVTTTCPHKFIVSASFDVRQAATVTYQLEAGGFALTLPAPRSEALAVGSYTFTYELEIAQSGTGWARLHVTAPADLLSNEVTFTLTCNP
jgi:hypothetical protein